MHFIAFAKRVAWKRISANKKFRASPEVDVSLETKGLALAEDSMCKSNGIGITNELECDKNNFDNLSTNDFSHTFNSMLTLARLEGASH